MNAPPDGQRAGGQGETGGSTASPPAVGADEVAQAAQRIAGHLRRTPVLDVESDAFGLIGAPLSLKLDLLQATGSFKARGALSLLRAEHVPDAGVVAASGGNFGLGIAWAASRLGHRASVFVPSTSPAAKIDALRALGAQVTVVDGYYAQALEAADAWCSATGALRAHAYDQRAVVAGQGTAAAELDEQADVDTVVVACGGGGLLAGVAGWFANRARIVAVETEGTATYATAIEAGGPVDVEISGVAASSLGARRLGALAWAARDLVDDHVVLSDEQVVDAQRRLWRATRLLAEPGGAAALAAVLAGAVRRDVDERIAVLICGGNLDPSDFHDG